MRKLLIILAILQFNHFSYAAPQGGSIIAGNGSITQINETTTIGQLSRQMYIDWHQFNIGKSEVVNFIQPDMNSIVVNNTYQTTPSIINGHINANGQVILVNPKGIIFGANSVINSGGLVASTLHISKDDFLNGNYYFKNTDSHQGIVVNKGLISAASGVTFLSEAINNTGTIEADLGYINLATGSGAYLTFDDMGFIGVKVTDEVLNNDLGLDNAIVNKGIVTAGRVLFSAEAASQLFDHAVNNSGIIKSSGFGFRNPEVTIQSTSEELINSGKILAIGSEPGRVVIDGKTVTTDGQITASSYKSKGGEVQLLGDNVRLSHGSSVDASGKTDGGTVLVGGDYQGKNPEIKNAKFTLIDQTASINANAGEHGDGGKIIVWSDNTTKFYGDVLAKGGSKSGDGGFVEISGKQKLRFSGSVDLNSANGYKGKLLLDPRTVTIVGPSQGLNDNVFDTGFTIDKNDSPNEDFTISANIIELLLTDVDLDIQALQDITVSYPINIPDSAGASLSLLSEFGNININQSVNIPSNPLLLNALNGVVNIASDVNVDVYSFNTSAIDLLGSGSIAIGTDLDLSTTNISRFNGLFYAQGAEPVSLIGLNNNTNDVVVSEQQDDVTAFYINNAQFSNFYSVDTSFATLVGSNADDNFNRDDGVISVHGIIFSNLFSNIDGAGGQDTFSFYGEDNLILSSLNEIQMSDISVSNTEHFNLLSSENSTLNTSQLTEVQMTLDAGNISVGSMTFNGINRVASNVAGNDKLIFKNGLIDHGPTPDLRQDFLVIDNNSMSTSGIEFEGIDGVVIDDMPTRLDSLIMANANNNNVYLNGADKSVSYGNITFDNIDNVDVNYLLVPSDYQGLLSGSDQDDTFTIMDGNKLNSNNISFNNISEIRAGGGNDIVYEEAGNTWNVVNQHFVKTSEILISEAENFLAEASYVMLNGVNNVIDITNELKNVAVNSLSFTGVQDISADTLSYTNKVNIVENSQLEIAHNDTATVEMAYTMTNLDNDLNISNLKNFDIAAVDSIYAYTGLDGASLKADTINFDITNGSELNLTNITANTFVADSNGSITFKDFSISNLFQATSSGNITFTENALLNSAAIKLETTNAASLKFNQDLIIRSNNVELISDNLIVEGAVDLGINSEITERVDIGRYLNLAIFKAVNTFTAGSSSMGSTLDRKIDSSERLRELLEQTEVEL